MNVAATPTLWRSINLEVTPRRGQETTSALWRVWLASAGKKEPACKTTVSYSAILQSIRPLPLYFSAQWQPRQSPEVSRNVFYFLFIFFLEGTENICRWLPSLLLMQPCFKPSGDAVWRRVIGRARRRPLWNDSHLEVPKKKLHRLQICIIFLQLGRYKTAIELDLVFTLNGVNLFQDSLFQRNLVSRQRVKNPIRRE